MNVYRRKQVSSFQRGQSLVEFVVTMPILVFLLVVGASLGIGAYQSHMASDAVRETSLQKLNFSNQPGAVSTGNLVTMINAGALQGKITTGGPLIDSTSIVNVASENYNSVIVGTKQITPTATFVPGFTVRVGQVINRNLLQAANAGSAQVRQYSTPWVPGGAPKAPPWEAVGP